MKQSVQHASAKAVGGVPTLAGILPRVRAERLIGLARLALAVCCLLAVVVDPPETQRLPVTQAILVGYVAFALLMIALGRRSSLLLRLQWVGHAVDVLAFAMVLLATQGAASSFFATILFPVVAATLRWHWRGALFTGVAVVMLFGLMAVSGLLRNEAQFRPLLVRSASLLAIVALLAYLGAADSGFRGRLVRLAEWPQQFHADLEELAQAALGYVRGFHGAAGAALLLNDPEEPWTVFAILNASGFTLTQESNEEFAQPVAENLLDTAFLAANVNTDRPRRLVWDQGSVVETPSEVFKPSVARSLGADVVIGVPLRGVQTSGWLLLLDPPNSSPDDILLATTVGRQVATSIDQCLLLRDLKLLNKAEERARVSRDLHDGVLQSLTAASLHLQSIRQLSQADPAAAGRKLEQLEQLLLDEQRDLRFYTLDLRAESGAADSGFEAQVAGLADRLRGVWGLAVRFDPSAAARIPAVLQRDVYRLLQEALVNSVRHGRASEATVGVVERDGVITVSVTDNGRGFAFRGDLGWDELQRNDGAPRSITDRVRSLHGELRISSGKRGATLEMRLPASASA